MTCKHDASFPNSSTLGSRNALGAFFAHALKFEGSIGTKLGNMVRKLTLVSAIMLTFGTAVEAQTLAALEQARPKLKSETIVTGSIVRIGDLVEHAGIVSKVPVFRSPDLGSTGTVSAAAVIEAVRAHALIGLDTGGLDEVVVTRAARTIAPQELESAIATALSAKFAIGQPRDVAVNFDRGLRPLLVEPVAKGELRVTRISYDASSARFDATLEIPGSASLRLTGQARAMMDVVTLTQPVKRGEILKQADMMIERRPRNGAGRDLIMDRDQAVGLAARNSMQAGRPLRTGDLMKPEIVQRNETVTLVYQAPGITLTVRGKAAESGAEGDAITVLNEQSKRTVQGVVAGPGRVVISTRGPRLAANIRPATAGAR